MSEPETQCYYCLGRHKVVSVETSRVVDCPICTPLNIPLPDNVTLVGVDRLEAIEIMQAAFIEKYKKEYFKDPSASHYSAVEHSLDALLEHFDVVRKKINQPGDGK